MMTKQTEPPFAKAMAQHLRFQQAMSLAETATLDMGAKKFVELAAVPELLDTGYRLYTCDQNPAVRFLRREGSPDLLFYT